MDKKDLEEKDFETNNNKNDDKTNKKYKTIIGVVCAVIVLVQIVLNSFFDIQFETKIIVETVSIVISALILLGVIKNKNGSSDIAEIKKDVNKTIEENIENLKNKK